MTKQGKRTGRARTVLLGIIGFGVGMGAAGAVFGGTTFRVSDFETNLFVGTGLFLLGGLIGGACLALGQRFGLPRVVASALAGGIGLGLGYFATVSVYSTYFADSIQGDTMAMAAYVIQFAVIGATAGLLLALLQRSGLRALLLVLAGAIGFGLGFFVQDIVGSVVDQPISNMIPGQLGDPNHDSLTLAAIFGVTFLLAGAIGGGGLGLAFGGNKPAPAANTPAIPSTDEPADATEEPPAKNENPPREQPRS